MYKWTLIIARRINDGSQIFRLTPSSIGLQVTDINIAATKTTNALKEASLNASGSGCKRMLLPWFNEQSDVVESVHHQICVFRSNKHIYAQVISDAQGKTLATVSTLSDSLEPSGKKAKGVEVAKLVGLALAKICQEKNITQVVFDRNGFLFHGRVKAVADGAREGGLKF